MKRTARSYLVLAAVLVLGMSTWVLAADPETPVSNASTLSAMSKTVAYWTPERMQNAKPHPLPARPGSPPSSPATLQAPPTGAPGLVPGRSAGSSVLLSGDESVLHALAGASAVEGTTPSPGDIQALAGGYDYPPPHATYYVYSALYGTTRGLYPYKAVGRVFFTASGFNFACSGSSIGTRSVLTAGHCVSDGAGNWHSNWVFIPNYRNTKPTTANMWTAEQLWSLTGWIVSGDFAYDIGCAVTAKKGTRTLSSRVGSLGVAWNQSTTQHWAMVSYPAVSPYDGKWLVQTDASLSRADTSFTPNTLGIGTAQTAGSSGGPWIIGFTPSLTMGANNYVNGVTSYIYVGSPNEVFSPYFGDGASNLYTACTR